MQLYNLLRPRDILFTENGTIAEFNEDKIPEEAEWPDIPKYK